MNVIIGTTKNYEVPILKQLVDNITNEVNNSFVLLANVNKNNVNIICKTNTRFTSPVKTGIIIRPTGLF